jgi:hypothetical protein
MDRSTAITLASGAYDDWLGRVAPGSGAPRSTDFDARPIVGGWRCWPTAPGRVLGALHVLVREDGEVTRCPAALGDDAAAVLLAELD